MHRSFFPLFFFVTILFDSIDKYGRQRIPWMRRRNEKKKRNKRKEEEKEKKADRERPRCVVFDYVTPSNAVTFHKRQRPTARILASNFFFRHANRRKVGRDPPFGVIEATYARPTEEIGASEADEHPCWSRVPLDHHLSCQRLSADSQRVYSRPLDIAGRLTTDSRDRPRYLSTPTCAIRRRRCESRVARV